MRDGCKERIQLVLQRVYHQRQFKKQYRQVQRLKHSTSQNENKRQRKQAEIQQAHRVYLELAQSHLARAEQSRQQIDPRDPVAFVRLQELNN